MDTEGEGWGEEEADGRLQNTSQRRLHQRPRQSHVLQSVALEVASGMVPLGHIVDGIIGQCPGIYISFSD